MEDLFDLAEKNTPPAPVAAQVNLQVDPRLLAKALKKVQGLVRGNGLRVEDVRLDGEHQVKMYRFRARSFLRLATEYGIKTEAGRNTKCELMPTQESFHHAVAQVIIDARLIPEKRKQIVDFMFARSDKGFGIKDQRIKFQFLTRDFVQHEKCIGCKNTGRVGCSKCQGHGVLSCVNCQGRRQVVCPRCRGTTKVHLNNETVPCDYCRADGKINCPKCAGRGQQKCGSCAASGSLLCQPCAGSGWLSHMAHIETYAQMFFDFDREGMPQPLVSLIEKNAARLVEKNDIEVSLTKGWGQQERAVQAGGLPVAKDTDNEPDDMIWLDYDAMCPYGSVVFQLKERELSANLFGFQARLNDCPPFLEGLTKIGQQALIEASTGQGDVSGKIRKAAKYAVLRDIITQTLRLKNPIKTQQFMLSKYAAGMSPNKFAQLISATDLSVRHITRKPRIIGLVFGLSVFTALTAFYFLAGARVMIHMPLWALWGFDALFPVLGIFFGIAGAKFAALWSQNRALKGVVADDVLRHILPKAGRVVWWAIGLSMIIFLGILSFSWFNNAAPEWVYYFLKSHN